MKGPKFQNTIKNKTEKNEIFSLPRKLYDRLMKIRMHDQTASIGVKNVHNNCSTVARDSSDANSCNNQ